MPNSDLSTRPRASSEIAVVSWYTRFGSQDIEEAKFVGKLVATGGLPAALPLFWSAPR